MCVYVCIYMYIYIYIYIYAYIVGGFATRYELDSPGFESRWGEIFGTRPDRPRSRSRFLYSGFLVFVPGVKQLERGVAVYFRLAPRLKNDWGISLPRSVPSSTCYIWSRVRLQAGACGIFGGQCGAETGCSQNTSVLLSELFQQCCSLNLILLVS